MNADVDENWKHLSQYHDEWKRERLDSDELGPENMATCESDVEEEDWMQEVEIDYHREISDNTEDPLGDWRDQSSEKARNEQLKELGKEDLKLEEEIMIPEVELYHDDEDWMEEEEIMYTRDEDEAVDPLGDSGNESAIQENADNTDHSIDGIAYIENGLHEKPETLPGDSKALVVNVYAPKPQEAHPGNHGNRLKKRQTSNKRPYGCRLCDFQSNNRYDLHVHCRSHYGEGSFEAALNSLSERQTRGKPGVCSICGEEFPQSGLLMSHMKTHKIEQYIRRKPSKNRTSGARSSHRSPPLAEPGTNSNIKDDDIPKSTSNDLIGVAPDPLNGKGIENQEKRAAQLKCLGIPYACKSCEYRSSRKHDLKKHEENHNAQKPNQCPKCSYRCKRAGYLKLHMKLHADGGTSGRPRKPKNGNEKLQDCPICHYRTRQMGNMKVHMRAHTGEQPYVCSLCQKRFTQAVTLKIHMNGHTGERPYKCDVCGKGFTQISNRNSHQRNCPYIQKMEMCDICNFTCRRTSDLRIHMKIHTSIRIVRL